MPRTISPTFMADLKEGVLSSLVQAVRFDDTLMLAIRDGYINVYYRGGSIMHLEAASAAQSRYSAVFDSKYITVPSLSLLHDLPRMVSTQLEAERWVLKIPMLKQAVDRYHACNKRRAEREFQQLVVWENNRSSVANDSEYFITDIEFADRRLGARLDMLGVKWLASDRKMARRCSPVLIEMKYGDDSIAGKSGIIKHYNDVMAMISRDEFLSSINGTINSQFHQLDELGLIDFKRSRLFKGINVSGVPELIFVFSNHNPRSLVLINELELLKGLVKNSQGELSVRFFVSTFTGYAMHDTSMMNIDQFLQYLMSFSKLISAKL